jgi:hypothetical protein
VVGARQEHYGGAPVGRYLDERTAGQAVRSLGLLGARRQKHYSDAVAAAAAAATAADVAAAAAAKADGNSRRDRTPRPSPLHPQPWFMAVGFVRPHLPFVCPQKFWDATDDGPGDAFLGAKEAALGRGASLGGRMLTHQEGGDSGFGEVFFGWW